MTFEKFCEKRKVKLTPFQVNLASPIIEAISQLSDEDINNMTMLGSGVSTVFNLIESYYKYDAHIVGDE